MRKRAIEGKEEEICTKRCFLCGSLCAYGEKGQDSTKIKKGKED